MPRPPTARRAVDYAEIARLTAARHDRLRVARVRDGQTINEYGEKPWGDSAMPLGPYAVYLARAGLYYTLAFDLDAHGGCTNTDSMALGRMLSEAGIGYVEALSGPAGGRHLIARFTHGLPPERVRALAQRLRAVHTPSLDPSPLSNHRTGAIRPPGSPHRSGGVSTLTTPIGRARRILAGGNSLVAFDALCESVGIPQAVVRSGGQLEPRSNRPLNERILALEQHGDTEGRYHDRSSTAAAICLGYVNSGRSCTEFTDAALDYSRPGLDHLRRTRMGPAAYGRRSTNEIIAAAGRMWAGRQVYAAQRPAVAADSAYCECSAEVAQIMTAMDANPARWGGQAGPSDRAVLSAVLATVLRCRHPVVACATRTIAEQSGITRSSASRALKRLAHDGWLIAVSAGEGIMAATYRPAIPAPSRIGRAVTATSALGGTLDPAPPAGETLRISLAVRAHDAMCYEGLGRYGAAVFVALLEGHATVPDISAHTGLIMRTVRRHLTRLAAKGLASDVDGAWHAHDTETLDEAASQMGLTGAGRRRAAAHALEREAYHWYLADYAARRGFTVDRGLWQPGRHTLLTADRRPVPSIPYPRRGSRADSKIALDLITAGRGPTLDSIARAQTEISQVTEPARRPRTASRLRSGTRPGLASP